MKRILLPVMAAAVTALSAIANEHTLVFDGDNDLYGIKRQNTIDAMELKFSEELSFSEAGIDFSMTIASDTGRGFALVNAGGTDAGICVYSAYQASTAITPLVTLTVPSGKITAAKVYMSGTLNNAGLSSLDLSFNGKNVESEKEGPIYFWAWQDAEGSETLSFEWPNTYYTRFIHSIELTYTEDLKGKKECGLAFSRKEAEVIMGEPFTAPSLTNPNKLPVNWTSTDEAVATVGADGGLTLLKGGKTTIIASTDGNAEYAAGKAKYDLRVVPLASDIAQMNEYAPEFYDRVKVNFPVTVMFGDISFAWVVDAEGNAGCFQNIKDQGTPTTTPKTLYKVGDVIPAGWIATNATIYGSVIWQGIPGDVKETVDVTYPEVESVSMEDVDRVVVLKKVTFKTATPMEMGKTYGTASDGMEYEFQNTYGVSQYPAGTYDVTCVIRYSRIGSTGYLYIAPIDYVKCAETGINAVEATDGDARYYDLRGVEVANPASGIYVKVSGGGASKVMIE